MTSGHYSSRSSNTGYSYSSGTYPWVILVYLLCIYFDGVTDWLWFNFLWVLCDQLISLKCFIDMFLDNTRHYFVPWQHIRPPQPPALPGPPLHHPALHLLAATRSRHQAGQEGAAPALAGHPSHHHCRQDSHLQLHNFYHILHWSSGVCRVSPRDRNSPGGLTSPLEAGLSSVYK